MAATIEPDAPERRQPCRWKRFHAIFTSECGNNHVDAFKRHITDYFKFCPYCGKEIEEVTDGER